MWGLLRVTVGWSGRECRERVQLARLVSDFGELSELLADGQVSVANMVEIARGHANERCGDQIGDVVGTLAVEACRMEHDDFRRLVQRRVQLADIDGAHRDAVANHQRRTASCWVWDGIGHLEASFGEVDGLTNREIFDRYVQAEWHADWDAVVAEHGDHASVVFMPRTPGQRRSDALSAIFQAAASSAPRARAPRPVLNVFVDHHTFVDLLAEADLLPERFVDPYENVDPPTTARRCDTEHGDPINPRTAAQIAIDGLVRFVIVNDQGVPLRWGTTRRFFTGAARDAVMSLSPRCTHPGCRVPARRCDADHTQPWAQHGRTDPDNVNPKCRRHNLLGNHGYTTTRDHHGHWHTHRPDGTEIP